MYVLKMALTGLGLAVLMAPSTSFGQQKSNALDQAKKANEGAAARDHVFDGRRPPPNAVQANPSPKPNPVGTPVREFKPQVKVAPSKPPPPPPR